MSQEALAYQDQRANPRRQMMRRATLLVSPTQQVGCTIRNLSRDGAMIALDEPLELPKRLVLDLSGNIVVRRTCDVVWQGGLLVGVHFAGLRGVQALQFNPDT